MLLVWSNRNSKPHSPSQNRERGSSPSTCERKRPHTATANFSSHQEDQDGGHTVSKPARPTSAVTTKRRPVSARVLKQRPASAKAALVTGSIAGDVKHEFVKESAARPRLHHARPPRPSSARRVPLSMTTSGISTIEHHGLEEGVVNAEGSALLLRVVEHVGALAKSVMARAPTEAAPMDATASTAMWAAGLRDLESIGVDRAALLLLPAGAREDLLGVIATLHMAGSVVRRCLDKEEHAEDARLATYREQQYCQAQMKQTLSERDRIVNEVNAHQKETATRLAESQQELLSAKLEIDTLQTRLKAVTAMKDQLSTRAVGAIAVPTIGQEATAELISDMKSELETLRTERRQLIDAASQARADKTAASERWLVDTESLNGELRSLYKALTICKEDHFKTSVELSALHAASTEKALHANAHIHRGVNTDITLEPFAQDHTKMMANAVDNDCNATMETPPAHNTTIAGKGTRSGAEAMGKVLEWQRAGPFRTSLLDSDSVVAEVNEVTEILKVVEEPGAMASDLYAWEASMGLNVIPKTRETWESEDNTRSMSVITPPPTAIATPSALTKTPSLELRGTDDNSQKVSVFGDNSDDKFVASRVVSAIKELSEQLGGHYALLSEALTRRETGADKLNELATLELQLMHKVCERLDVKLGMIADGTFSYIVSLPNAIQIEDLIVVERTQRERAVRMVEVRENMYASQLHRRDIRIQQLEAASGVQG